MFLAAAADYLAVCEHFHTVFMENVPILKADQRNEIRRLILLVDELYQHKVKRRMPMVMMCTLYLLAARPLWLLANALTSKFDAAKHTDPIGGLCGSFCRPIIEGRRRHDAR